MSYRVAVPLDFEKFRQCGITVARHSHRLDFARLIKNEMIGEYLDWVAEYAPSFKACLYDDEEVFRLFDGFGEPKPYDIIFEFDNLTDATYFKLRWVGL